MSHAYFWQFQVTRRNEEVKQVTSKAKGKLWDKCGLARSRHCSLHLGSSDEQISWATIQPRVISSLLCGDNEELNLTDREKLRRHIQTH